MKSASPSSAQAQIGWSPGSGETVSVRLTGTKLARADTKWQVGTAQETVEVTDAVSLVQTEEERLANT